MPSIWTFFWMLAGMACLQRIMACYDNINSNGSTEPVGDITVPLGGELVINCTLNASYKGPRNASNIFWVIARRKISSPHVTILNERSAQLRIRNVSADYCGKLTCKLEPDSTLCMNTVTTLAPIPERDQLNFRCTSYEWKSLKCEWKLPPSCRHMFLGTAINWTLSYSKHGWTIKCPKILDDEKGSYNCVFDDTTRPTYDYLKKTFSFKLSVKTAFEENNFSFEVDHFSRVIASPPKNLRNSSYDSTKLKLVWNAVEKFKFFPAKLVYQLKYRSEWDKPGYFKEIPLIFNQTSFEIDDLIPYTYYSVWLRCRSENATDEAMWSKYINATFQTLGAVPKSYVDTTPGNFIEISNGIEKRSVTLFWKPIPRSQHFGPNFHYIVWKYSDGDKNMSSIISEESFSYGPDELSNNKSYLFKIQAANDLGSSQDMGTIFIDKSSQKVPEAEGLALFHLKSGLYNVTWKPPKSKTLVSSYHLVWCKGPSYALRWQPCNNPLDWTSVPANETTKLIEVDDKSGNRIYRFGVAVNTDFGTSGLTTWSKCIAPYDGILGKVEMDPLVVEAPTSIKVSWKLDCSQQFGVITGFQVQYCSLDRQDGNCRGVVYRKTIEGAEKRSFSITGLRPYTYYSVTVAGMAKQVGEACQPLTARTLQAAPSDPPSNLAQVAVTNSSISVHWKLPSSPNGILTYFLVRYNNSYGIPNLKNVSNEGGKLKTNLTKNVECYTNYTITVEACTVSGCSPQSQTLTVLTDIGVPGQPEIPKARTLNDTHVILEWDEPTKPNGPISQWNLFIVKYGEDAMMNSTVKLSSSPFFFPVQCDENIDVETMEYRFAVQAVTATKEGDNLMSEWSDFAALNVCSSTLYFGMGLVSFMIFIICGLIAIILVVAIGCYCHKSVLPKFNKLRQLVPDLPEGLIKDGKIGYNDFEKKLNRNKLNLEDDFVSEKVLNRLQSISSDEGRGSQNSTETSLHNTSSFSSINDENMYTDKTSFGHFRNKHNMSSDSSGCSTGEGSLSSTLTTRMHFPSDSGTEADLPTPLTSPDSVFYDAWPAGVTSACQLRLRTLQRLGEEDTSIILVSGEKSDVDQLEKEDLTQSTATHYFKPAIKSDPDASTMKSNNIDSNPMNESTEIETDASPSNMYSRLALTTPPRSKTGYQTDELENRDSRGKESKVIHGTCTNSESNTRGESMRPASYVALAILSDTSRVQAVPLEESVRGSAKELMTPYSCVGLVNEPRAVACSNEDLTHTNDTAIPTNVNVHKMDLPDVSGQYSVITDATHFHSVPCSSLEKGFQQMPSQKGDQITINTNQIKPKRPSYIALSRIEDPSTSKLCHSGYSKVGQQDLSARNLAKAELDGNSVLVDKSKNVIEKENTGAPAIRGYVTLGLSNPSLLNEALPLADAKLGPKVCKLSFDPSLVDEPTCDGYDGSTWESELEISEENVTEEDLHFVVQQPSSTHGYVCLAMSENKEAKAVV